MKQIVAFLSLAFAVSSAPAAIEILYVAPSDTAPVLGSISTDSDAFKEAVVVEGREGREGWMEVVREDYYSGFIARDSLTPDGEVEIGTALLLTPSKSGRVLTRIEEEDEVTVNLVDDWTEITVRKAIPGYFKPMDEATIESMRRAAPPPPSSLSFAEDPLLSRVAETRYTAPSSVSPAGVVETPVANRATTPTAEPMTGFEEVETLNPAFGRTAPDGTSRGFSLGPGSTPVPAATAADGSSTFRSGSMQDPVSIARIPRVGTEGGLVGQDAPTQSETVDRLEDDADGQSVPAVEDRMGELERRMADIEADTTSEQTVEEAAVADEVQEEATASVEGVPSTPADVAPEDAGVAEESVEVIPLVPEPGDETGPVEPEPAPEPEEVEENPAEILSPGEDVEVSEQVAEAVVPGVASAYMEEEPPLIPPTDTNRTYIGRLQRTKSGFFGGKPPQSFEIVNYDGGRIAYIDLSEVPMSSEEKFVDRIVRVYGTMLPSPEDGDLTIKAVNITLR